MAIPFENSDLEQINQSIAGITPVSGGAVESKQYEQRPSEKTGRVFFSFTTGRSNGLTTNILTLPNGKTLYITSLSLSAENPSTTNFQEFRLQTNGSPFWTEFIGTKVATGNSMRLKYFQQFQEPIRYVSTGNVLEFRQQVAGNLLFFCLNLVGYIE